MITGKLDEAVQIFTEVITVDTENSKYNKELYEFRGEANFQLRYYAAAFADFSEALKVGEKSARCLYLRACCHHAMGQFEDCLIDCEASMKIQWDQQTQSLYEDVINMLGSFKKCPFYILGLPRNASMQEIKVAYQNLTLKYHPSQNTDATEEERMKLDWKFEEIAKAYVQLNKPKPTILVKQEQPCNSASVLPKIKKEQMTRVENDFNRMKICKQSKSKEECSVM